MNSADLMFSLLRSELFGTDEIIENITEEELSELYKLSKKHDMAHIVASALSKRGLLDGEVGAKFQKQQMLAVYRYSKSDYELNQIHGALEEAEIPHVALKGAIIRRYYDQPWMRTSCDIDMLVREEDLDRAVAVITDKLGYKAEENKNYHDISLFSESGVHLELHFSIKENMDNIDPLLSKVWDHCVPFEGAKCRFEQTHEYFMFHHIAHMSYHFIMGGCGVKPFADLYLLMKKGGYDEDTVISYCAECGLERFYESVKLLARAWFGNEEHTELSLNMEKFLLAGGVYGTKDNAVALSAGKKGGKIRYAFSRIFVPYKLLKYRYPILEKHKWMMPFMQVRRWIEVLFGGKMQRSVGELKAATKIDNDRAFEVKNLFDEIGL